MWWFVCLCVLVLLLGVVDEGEFNGRVEGYGETVPPTVLDGHNSLVLQKVEVVDVPRGYHKPYKQTKQQ